MQQLYILIALGCISTIRAGDVKCVDCYGSTEEEIIAGINGLPDLGKILGKYHGDIMPNLDKCSNLDLDDDGEYVESSTSEATGDRCYYINIYQGDEDSPLIIHRGAVGEDQELPIEWIKEYEFLENTYITTKYCSGDYCNHSSHLTLSFSALICGLIVILYRYI